MVAVRKTTKVISIQLIKILLYIKLLCTSKVKKKETECFEKNLFEKKKTILFSDKLF